MTPSDPPSSPALGPVSIPSWTEQDDVLRTLWGQGEKPEMIAEKLGRSVAAVMTRAARLGLPRRFSPGRKPSRNKDAAKQITRRSTRQVVDTGASLPQYVERICLMCLTKFPSAGRHNRICQSCKETPEYAHGSALPDVSLPE